MRPFALFIPFCLSLGCAAHAPPVVQPGTPSAQAAPDSRPEKDPSADLGPSLYLDPSAEELKSQRQLYFRLGLRHTDLTNKFSPFMFLSSEDDRECEGLRREGELLAIKHFDLDRQALLISANLGIEFVGYELGRLTNADILAHLTAYEKTLDAMTSSLELMKSKEKELIQCLGRPNRSVITS